MKYIVLGALIVISALSFSGCSTPKDSKEEWGFRPMILQKQYPVGERPIKYEVRAAYVPW
jgi:hypothetical protein